MEPSGYASAAATSSRRGVSGPTLSSSGTRLRIREYPFQSLLPGRYWKYPAQGPEIVTLRPSPFSVMLPDGGRTLGRMPPVPESPARPERSNPHDPGPLSDLSDLPGGGAPEKSSGLTRHRWMSRPPVFVVTSFSQPARTKPSSKPRVCSASSRRPSASRRMSNSDTSGFRFVRIQHSARRALVCFSVSPSCRSAARLCGQK